MTYPAQQFGRITIERALKNGLKRHGCSLKILTKELYIQYYVLLIYIKDLQTFHSKWF